MEKALKAGLLSALRVFVTENWEFAPVNRDRVTQLVPGVASGIWTPWALRTLQTTDGKATVVEYSSQGALFMSPWNTVLGFNDVYSELMGRLVRDFDFYPSPINGMPVPIRVKSYKVTYNVTVPDDALVYNPKDKKWEPLYAGETVGPFGDPIEKVVVNFNFGKWHDGRPVSMADVVYWYGFLWEWTSDESTNTTTDPYYDPEVEEAAGYSMYIIRGLKVINATAMEVYISYLDVYDVLIADQAIIWPDVAWTVHAAAEELIASGTVGTDQTLPYGWIDREGQAVGISFIAPQHAKDIKAKMQEFVNSGFIPKYITEFPGVSASTDDYELSIAFIDAHNHAMISNGPYYVDSYDPNSNTLVMKWFNDYVYAPGYWNTQFELYVPAFVASRALYPH